MIAKYGRLIISLWPYLTMPWTCNYKYMGLDNNHHFMQINQSVNMDDVPRYCKSMARFLVVIEHFDNRFV